MQNAFTSLQKAVEPIAQRALKREILHPYRSVCWLVNLKILSTHPANVAEILWSNILILLDCVLVQQQEKKLRHDER